MALNFFKKLNIIKRSRVSRAIANPAKVNLVPAIEYKDTYRDKMFALFDWQSSKRFFEANTATSFIRQWYPGNRSVPGLTKRMIRHHRLTPTQFYRFMNNY